MNVWTRIRSCFPFLYTNISIYEYSIHSATSLWGKYLFLMSDMFDLKEIKSLCVWWRTGRGSFLGFFFLVLYFLNLYVSQWHPVYQLYHKPWYYWRKSYLWCVLNMSGKILFSGRPLSVICTGASAMESCDVEQNISGFCLTPRINGNLYPGSRGGSVGQKINKRYQISCSIYSREYCWRQAKMLR